MGRPPLGAAFLCRLSMSIVSELTCERTMWLSGRYHPGQAPDNVRPDVLATTRARHPTMCSSNPYPRELPKTQTTSLLAARFQRFSPRWSAFWAPQHRKPRPRRRQSGGIAPCKGATRRRHAARRLRMAQNPHRSRLKCVASPPRPAQDRLARNNSPSTAPPAALPRKSSPSTHKNAECGVL